MLETIEKKPNQYLVNQLLNIAEALVVAKATDNNNQIMAKDAEDKPEGTYTVKMSLTVRDILIVLLREAAARLQSAQ